MIRIRTEKSGDVRVTFAVEDPRPVSLVCDLNGWDPYATPLKRRGNGTRSAALTVPPGTEIRFRYLAEHGDFYDDPQAQIECNGIGGTHSLLRA